MPSVSHTFAAGQEYSSDYVCKTLFPQRRFKPQTGYVRALFQPLGSLAQCCAKHLHILKQHVADLVRLVGAAQLNSVWPWLADDGHVSESHVAHMPRNLVAHVLIHDWLEANQ